MQVALFEQLDANAVIAFNLVSFRRAWFDLSVHTCVYAMRKGVRPIAVLMRMCSRG